MSALLVVALMATGCKHPEPNNIEKEKENQEQGEEAKQKEILAAPNFLTLRVGEKRTFALSDGDIEIQLTDPSIPFTLTVKDPSIAKLNGNEVEGLKTGRTTVVITSGGITYDFPVAVMENKEFNPELFLSKIYVPESFDDMFGVQKSTIIKAMEENYTVMFELIDKVVFEKKEGAKTALMNLVSYEKDAILTDAFYKKGSIEKLDAKIQMLLKDKMGFSKNFKPITFTDKDGKENKGYEGDHTTRDLHLKFSWKVELDAKDVESDACRIIITKIK